MEQFLSMILLLFVNAGGSATDLASLIKPEDYFQERSMGVSANEMLQVAGAEPKDAKTSFQQLLALRWLAEHPAELKKAKDARKLLETLAAGKKGDAQGFARDYAVAALAVLDGKTPPLRTMPENSVTVDALSWFPAKSAIFGAVDLRLSPDAKVAPDDSVRNLVQRMLLLAPARTRNEIYGFAEKVGNVRVDRVAFAGQIDDPQKPEQGKIYLRVTGLADRARLVEHFQKLNSDNTVQQDKGPRGEPITIVDQGRKNPAVAVVGDTDLIIAGYERPQDNNLALVKELLAIRAAGKGSVTGGPLADLLKRAPAGASAILAGEMKPLRKGIIGGLVGPGGPFTVVPDRLLIDRTTGKATDLRWYGTFDTAEDAKAFAGNVSTLKQQGTAALKSIPENVKIKKETVALLLKTLEGVKADANGKAVTGGVQLAPEFTKVLVEFAELWLSYGKVPPEGGRE